MLKIYFACTVRGDRTAAAASREAAARLRSFGHEVLTAHLLEEDVEAREAALSERDVFERDLRWLDACDVLVAEASGSSFGVGFEVGYVLARAPQTRQHVFLLYDQARSGRISRLITGAGGAHCTAVPYRSPADLLSFVDDRFSGRSLSSDRAR